MKRFLLPLVVLGTSGLHLHAQSIGNSHAARFAASRGSLQIGVAGSYLRPDYGFGVGYMVNPYASLDFKKSYLGVEVDGNFTAHARSESHPNSLMFGLRGLYNATDSIRLYVKPAIGYGHFSGVTTSPSPQKQNYLVYEIGGGVDAEVTTHLNLRAYGAYQVWPNFDGDTTKAYDHGGVLNPIMAGVGVAYHF